MKQLLLDLLPVPAPTLANFVAGRNREAFATLSALLAGDAGAASAVKVVYFWGEPGSGKSHLVDAALDAGATPMMGPARSPRRVAVDDAQTLDADAQQTLFNLINEFQQVPGTVIAAGNAAPRDLPIRRDLASRLGSGLVFQLLPLTDEEKAEALRSHARSRGFALREDVIAYLLRHARRDMASLIGLLDALDRHSIETGREITLPLLKEMSQPATV